MSPARKRLQAYLDREIIPLPKKRGSGSVMDRRNFLKTSGVLIAGATLVPSGFALEEGTAEGRLILPMNRDWRFSRSVVEGAHLKDFDDSAYERVVVSHTNVRLPWRGFDEKRS